MLITEGCLNRRLSHQHLTSRGMIDDVISDVGTRLLLSDVESGSRDTKKKGMQYNRRSDTNLTGQAILRPLPPTPYVPGRRRLRI